MPNTGDELHHFGWNACSSCLCPNAPHAHAERRYLVVPGLRSSRIHILDTKPDPKNPKIVKVIEPAEVAEKAGYTRPHTVHCGPEGIYVAALGNREGKGPGGVFLMDHETFEVRGQWEIDRGPQHFAYDAWWHLGHDTLVTSEWGTPDTFENGLIPEVLLGAKYGRRLHFWDLHKRKHLQTIDFGDKYQLVFELRPAHDPTKAYGFVNCVVSLENLSSSIWIWYSDGDKWAVKKIIEIPAEPAIEDHAAAAAQGLQGGAAAGHRHRPVDGRQIPLRRLLGHRRPAAVRRVRPVQAEAHGQGADRRHRLPATHPGAKNGALNGGPQMVEISRDGKRVYFTNSLYGAIDPQFYPEGIEGWMVKLDAKPGGRHRLRPEVLRAVAGPAPAAPGAARRRRLLVGFLLLSVAARTYPHRLMQITFLEGNKSWHCTGSSSSGTSPRSARLTGSSSGLRRRNPTRPWPSSPRHSMDRKLRGRRQDLLRLSRQGRGHHSQARGDQWLPRRPRSPRSAR